MTIRRLGITAGLCAITAGCGASNPANQITPSSVTSTASSIGGEESPRLVPQSIGSCPDGNSPGWLQTWTKGITARLRWTEVAPGIEYHVVVERYDVTNKFIPVDNGNIWVTNQTWAELTLSEGRYRARVQTRSCGQFMGPWSDELVFSVEGNDAPIVDEPTRTSPFTNGSFESDYANWSQTGNQRVVAAGTAGYETTDGSHSVVFNQSQRVPDGVLSQTFGVTSGRTYDLTFDVGAVSWVNQDNQSMQVAVTGATTLLNQTITVTAPGDGTSWASRTFTFVANSSTLTLTFKDVSATTDDVDLMLDNVRVTQRP